MELPKITIITASFNSEKTIVDAIESVLKQKYANIEYLIIDGGSSDSTVSIIKKYETLFDGRLKYISEKDAGIYDAWNKGVKLSTGSWISFVGSDDILFDYTILEFIDAALVNKKVNFISSKNLLVSENLDPIRIIGKPWTNKMQSYNCIGHVGSLHHKSLFDKKGLFDIYYRIVGDYDFLLRCSDIIEPRYLDILAAKVREGGISGSQILKVAKETLDAKIRNKTQFFLVSYIDYVMMIFKFIVRTKIINNLK
jgi:glycosyltransferase involved in cell wall biosynthesis